MNIGRSNSFSFTASTFVHWLADKLASGCTVTLDLLSEYPVCTHSSRCESFHTRVLCTSIEHRQGDKRKPYDKSILKDLSMIECKSIGINDTEGPQ